MATQTQNTRRNFISNESRDIASDSTWWLLTAARPRRIDIALSWLLAISLILPKPSSLPIDPALKEVLWPLGVSALGFVRLIVGRYPPAIETTKPILGSSLLLVVGIIIAPQVSYGYFAFSMVVFGLSLGFVLGCVMLSTRWTSGDLAILFIVVSTAFRALIQIKNASQFDIAHAHQFYLSWGQSNYVSDVLVLLSLMVLVKSPLAIRPGLVRLGAFIGVFAALALLSRGAIVALIFSAFVWILRGQRSRISSMRPLLRLIFVSVSVVALLAAFSFATSARFGSGDIQSSENVNIRFNLWQLSWNSIVHHPVVGIGFGGFRSVTSATAYGAMTHPHNFFLSFVTQAGIFALPFVILIGRLIVRSLVTRGSQRSAVAGALFVVLMIEPFAEGIVGAIVTGMVVAYLGGSAQQKSFAATHAFSSVATFD